MALIDVVPQRALAIYAHPDDADVSCGGTLSRWSAAGAHVEVVIATRGDKGSSDSETDPVELADRRQREAEAALALMGVAEHHRLEVPDGELVNDATTRLHLVRLIRSVRPDVVVAPDPTAVFFGSGYINHRDHRELGWAVLDAVAPAVSSPLYFPEAGPEHRVAELWLSGTLEADAHVDIGATIEAKVAALSCHASQVGESGEWLRRVVVQRAQEAGREVGVQAAESFRRMVLP